MKEILFLTDNDLINAGCFSLGKVMDITEYALKEYSDGNVMYPDKICQIFDEQYQSRINGLPATLYNDKVCGIKWISVFPNNPKAYGLSNISSLYCLSSIKDGFPLAVISGTLLSNMRTAAVGGVAAKYLCKKNPEKIGFIGAGEQAKMHFVAMKTAFPSIRECRVSSRTAASAEAFKEQMEKVYDDIDIIVCGDDYESAVRDTDIIVTAISGQSEILKAEWIKKGSFYCHVGGVEDEGAVCLMADKIVCDNWEMVKHRKQTVSLMYNEGKLKDEDIYSDLCDITTGKVAGRESDNEFIYFNSVGLSYVDLAISNAMYEQCAQKGVGVCLDAGETPVFERENVFDKIVKGGAKDE